MIGRAADSARSRRRVRARRRRALSEIGLSFGRDLAHRVVELAGRHEIDGGRTLQRVLPADHRVRADEADLQPRIGFLQARRGARVDAHGRRRRVHDHEIVPGRAADDLVDADVGRRRVDQRAARHAGRRLCEPRRIPERAHFAPRLIARAGAAVVALERRRVQEERLHLTSPTAGDVRDRAGAEPPGP